MLFRSQDNLFFCPDFASFNEFDIESGDINVSASLQQNQIIINVYWPLTIHQEGLAVKEEYSKADSLLKESQALYKKKKYSAALTLLNTTIKSKTRFTSWKDSSNVIYWRAVVTQKVYGVKKDKKIVGKAYNAWDAVKKRYKSKSSHGRFFEASNNMYKLFFSENVFRIPSDSLQQLKKRK